MAIDPQNLNVVYLTDYTKAATSGLEHRSTSLTAAFAATPFNRKPVGHPSEEPIKEPEMPADGDITRHELDAKLAAVEARLDAKLSDIAADIKITSSTVQKLAADVTEARSEFRTEGRTTRTTMIVTGIAVAVALVAAVWQMQSGLLSAFQAGLTARPAVSAPHTP